MQGRQATRCHVLIVLAALTISAPGGCSQAGAPSRDKALAEAEASRRAIQADVESRQALISRELKQTRSPWAGVYYEGDGLGENVQISMAPRQGVAASWRGCLGSYGVNAGRVVQGGDGWLRLDFQYPNPRGIGEFPDAVVPVAWGERRYLLRSDQLMEFVNEISNGTEPRQRAQGQFLLAEGDEHKAVKGLPSLPSGYAGRIRRRPVEVRVTKVELLSRKEDNGLCDARYRIQLQVAGGKTLYRDEALNVASDCDWARVRVIDSQPGLATASASTLDSGTCNEAPRGLAVGAQLSTGAYVPSDKPVTH